MSVIDLISMRRLDVVAHALGGKVQGRRTLGAMMGRVEESMERPIAEVER